MHDDQDHFRHAHVHSDDHSLTFGDVLLARAGGPWLMSEVALLRARQICGDVVLFTGGPGFDLWAWFQPEAHEVSRVQRVIGHAWGATWSFLAARPPCRRWIRNAVLHLDSHPALFIGHESDWRTIIVHDCLDELLPSFSTDHVVPSLARALNVQTLWFEAAPSDNYEERLAARFHPASVSPSNLTSLRARVRAARRANVEGCAR